MAGLLKPLFIGNFLSAKRGTLGPTETLAKELNIDGVPLSLTSTYESKVLRALDILVATMFRSYSFVCADVFSGNILKILPIVSIIADLRSKPIIFVLHGGQLPEVYQANQTKLNKIFRRAKLIVTPSPYLKSFFESKGFSLKYIPNAIQLDHFPYVAPSSNYIAPKLLWIRAFADIYNPTIAVDILVELRKTHPEASLTMIGPDSGKLAQTRTYIAQNGLENAIKIVGPMPNHNLSEYHHAHDVFINTTSYESFGVSVLEAAASGIPIVSSTVGSIPLLWKHDQDILMAKSIDSISFVQEIRRILIEPGLASQLTRHARDKAETFRIQSIVPQWRTLFDGLLDQ